MKEGERNKHRWKGRQRPGTREKKRWKNIRDRNECRATLKESNVLCAPRKHMVLPLTQRAMQKQLKYALQKGSEEYSRFWETVPDLK